MGASAAVGEKNRWIEQGGKSLLHGPRSCQPHRLGGVFNLQGGELIIIALLALVVLGPEKLPEAMRHVGRLYRQLRSVRDTFQREFKQALDEPMRDLRKATSGSADTLRQAARSMVEPATRSDESKPPSEPAPTAEPAAPESPKGTNTEEAPESLDQGEDSERP